MSRRIRLLVRRGPLPPAFNAMALLVNALFSGRDFDCEPLAHSAQCSGGDAVVFQLEADGGVAGHRFSVPAALVGPTLDAALARALARLPKSAAPRYVQQPPVAGVVAF